MKFTTLFVLLSSTVSSMKIEFDTTTVEQEIPMA